MNDEQYSEKDTLRRREATLKRMLSMPHKPHKPIGKKPKSPERKTRVSAKPKTS
jgi:hypothetical protein